MDVKSHKYQSTETKAVYTYHEVDDREECNLFLSLAALFAGFGGAMLLHMTPVYLPSVLRESFSFNSTLLFKLLMTILTVGLFNNSLYSLARGGITRPWSGGGLITGALGAIILGCGMAISRSDPLLLFLQLGTLTWSSLYVMIGALAGALTWGLVYDLLPREQLRIKPQYLDGICPKTPFASVGLPMCLLAAVSVFLLENGHSFKREGPILFKTDMWFSPYFVGSCIALIQFPLSVFFCKSFQGFCSWIATIAFPINQLGKLCNMKLPAYIRFTGSLSTSWSLLMGIGMFFGSLSMGVFNIRNTYFVEEGSCMTMSLTGGFLMSLGAIYSGGDAFTLVNGMANLHIPSYINGCLVFLGAWLTNRYVPNRWY